VEIRDPHEPDGRGAQGWAERLERSPELARAVEALGAHTLADRLDRARAGGDIVAVTLPALDGQWRAQRVKLHRQGGRDQVAEALYQGGWRGFEHPIPSVFRACVARAAGVVYDVGANTGLYSIVAAASTTARTYAFEPVPEIAAMARANLALNRGTDRVQLIESAVSDHTGTATIYLPPPINDTVETSASLDPSFKGHHERVVEIATTTLDDHWTSIGEPDVAVVKIDVEGHEVSVLTGAERMVERTQPVIFIEVFKHTDELDAFKERHTYVDVRMSDVEAIFGDSVRFDPFAWNHVLIPLTGVFPLADIAESFGLVATFNGFDERPRP
jgi:FkbM family methyltransferase